VNWQNLQLLFLVLNYPYFAPVLLQSIVLSMSVCVYVCSTVWPNFTKFFVHVSRGMARFSSDYVVIRYILPVLQMTVNGKRATSDFVGGGLFQTKDDCSESC